jgi:transposase InsO family protein
MKQAYPHISLVRLCRLLGVSRQAFYQYFRVQEQQQFDHELVLQKIRSIRQEHPRMGTRKLYFLLQPFFRKHHIKMGRDALFNLLAQHKLLVKKRQRYTTTFSKHWLRKWPNLIKEHHVDTINKLWVSDITYWKVGNTTYFISLITDVHSRKIIGYNIDLNLKTSNVLNALKMALSFIGNKKPKHLIHHSDRGVQYCSADYVGLLLQHNIKISMTENGEPTDNAIAERVNGILKGEYLNHYKPANLSQARRILAGCIHTYNDVRPHLSIGNNTPNSAYKCKNRKFERLWKNYYKNKTVNLYQDKY